MRRIGRMIATATAAVMLAGAPVSGVPGLGAFEAAAFTDIQGHWAGFYIMKAEHDGIVSGYGDSGKFNPDKAVTRAEFATMVNNACGNVLAYDVSYKDVGNKAWYYDTVCKSVSAGITDGYEDGTYRPERKITRQEAACIVARLLPTEGGTENPNSYPDGKKVASWAAPAFARVLGEHLMGSYDDGKLHPNSNLTRAQAVTILEKYKENFKDRKITESDDIKVTCGGITYSNKVYTNSVTISDNVGDETVTFRNCTFLGPVKVQGGGEKSVKFRDCRIKYMEVDRPEGTVRVVLDDQSSVGVVETYGSCILDSSGVYSMADGYGFGQVVLKKGAAVSLEGGFKDVRVTGEGTALKVLEGNVSYLEIPKGCGNANVTVQNKGSITSAVVNDKTDFHGVGHIGKLYAGTKDITYETAPDTVTMGEDVRVNPVKVDGEIAVSSSPANNDTGVSMKTNVVLTFSQPVYKSKKKLADAAYVKENVKFNAKKATGTEVPFTVKANDDGSVFTLTPDEELAKKTKYYITIEKEAFMNEGGEIYNKKLQIVFTTGDGTTDGVTFKPANDSSGAKANVKPSITFQNPVKAYDGESELTPAYLKDAISFYYYKEDTSTKDKKKQDDPEKANVKFKAEMAKKNKGITITPTKELEEGETYYIGINSRSFRFDIEEKSAKKKPELAALNNAALQEQTIKFTVGYVLPEIEFSPDPDKTKSISATSDFDVEFNQPVFTNDLKKLTEKYVKEGVTLTADGNAVEFTVKNITTKESSSNPEDDYSEFTVVPKTALPEDSEVVLTVAANKFFNKSKKASDAASAKYSVSLTTPVLSGLSATAESGKIVANFSANLDGTAYVAFTDGNDTMSASEVKSKGTSGKVSAGSGTITIRNAAIKPGENYSLYAILVAGSKTSEVVKGSVTAEKDTAYITGVTLTGLEEIATGDSASLDANVEDNMEIELDTALYSATSGVKVQITVPETAVKVTYSEAAGSSKYRANADGLVSSIALSPADLTPGTTKTIYISAAGSKKITKEYTLRIRVI